MFHTSTPLTWGFARELVSDQGFCPSRICPHSKPKFMYMTTTATSRTAQGLPPQVADPAVLRRLARILAGEPTQVPGVVGAGSAARSGPELSSSLGRSGERNDDRHGPPEKERGRGNGPHSNTVRY